MSTFYQHFGANLPTPNINISGERIQLSITHDYFDKVLSRKGAAPATGRDTLIKLQGRVARKLDTHDSENRLAGLPPRITRITV